MAFTIKTVTTVVTNDDFKGDSTADMLLFAITIDWVTAKSCYHYSAAVVTDVASPRWNIP